MRYPSWDEQDVADGERMTAIPVDEPAAASRYHVKLIPGVRGLLIALARSIVLYQHAAMGQDRGRALAFGNRVCHGLLDRDPSLLNSRI
jgi:hypothetical protein